MSAVPNRLGILSRSDVESTGTTNGRPQWRGRRLPSANRLARRRIMVVWAKRLLPVGALALLSLVVLWPEIGNRHNPARISYHIAPGSESAAQGSMTKAHYQGLDDSGRPFTLTADQAVQHDAERVSLVHPAGDITLKGDAWLMVQSRAGLYHAHAQHLDLSDHVTLYRDDGTTMRTPAATVDLKTDSAHGNDKVSADGPFGTLDAAGFNLTDHGTRIHFTGPAKLVLSGGS
jgi:lipopolysaccharide export system protein LptC